MDQKEFDLVMQKAAALKPKEAPAPVQEAAPPAADPAMAPPAKDATALDAEGRRPDGTLYSEPPKDEPGLGDASGLDAITGGAIKSVFETKDFVFGDTKPEDRSEFRESVEETVKLRAAQSSLDGFSAGVGQFAGAMIGLGKFTSAAKLVPWFGRGLTTLTTGGKVTKATAEISKAAISGAVAFDPWEDRLSNMVQDSPFANPINAWLAADPTDSAAEGRVKAALESIGMDLAVIGAFTGGVKVWKALRSGDAEGASAAVDALEAQKQADIAAAQKAEAPETAVEADPSASGVPAAGEVPGQAVEPAPAADLGDKLLEDDAVSRIDNATQVVNDTNATPALDNPAAEPQAGGTGSAAPEAGPAVGETAPSPAAGEAGAVTSTPSAAAAADGSALPNPNPRIRVSDEDSEGILKLMLSDEEAVDKHGGWYQAIEAGHVFGKGEGIPYAKLNAPADVDDFIARTVDVVEERIDKMRGGKVLGDEKLANMTAKMSGLYNTNPATILGAIHKAGKDAPQMVAMMETAYLVSNKLFQDAHAMALRLKMGDYSEWGSRELAMKEWQKRLSLASSVYGSARAMTAAAGRGVRAMQFRVDAGLVSKMDSMDPNQLLDLMLETKGDPRKVARMLHASKTKKVMDYMTFMLVNNLVSGPKTQIINLMSNGYMLASRPLERIIGGAMQGDGARVKAGLKQYAYMGTAFGEGFKFAMKTFVRNDSVLTPHTVELNAANQAANAIGPQWKPWDSPQNILYNSLLVGGARGVNIAIGMPTRLLGTVDEAVKQTVYRSKVMSDAYIEGVVKASAAGLKGKAASKFVKQYVADAAENSVDMQGRALNPKALQEAKTATFSQDLLPGSVGKWVQQGASQHPGLKLILPFVKTPTNVLRYGWKMTPLLNLAQTEYRDMLTGRMGKEMQAQAVGQMTMGTLYMGYAAYLVSQGTVTGGGPKDPKARAALQATGWQEYSFVSKDEETGKVTYTPFNRMDPVAIPIGIIADLMDWYDTVEEGEGTFEEIGTATGALAYALARQATNKTYLQSISGLMDAIQDPKEQGLNWLSTQASNMVPYASLQRQLDGDPLLREARGLADKIRDMVPGYGDKLPAKYDPWGNPRNRRLGLWSSVEDEVVDQEMIRMGMETGKVVTNAQPNHDGVDLRDITLEDGRNAYAVYQELSGNIGGTGNRSLKSRAAKIIESDRYKAAPDGDAGTKGSKLYILSDMVNDRRAKAMQRLKRMSPTIREAFGEKRKKVRDHYSALRGEQPKYPKVNQLQSVGETFGGGTAKFDLDAIK